ncbi:hypothetical protein PRIPAC_72180 [Pristionchus pacificus]|nr:hypothetical protein PRIPAC_72180 [Pristionchus pacificus]
MFILYQNKVMAFVPADHAGIAAPFRDYQALDLANHEIFRLNEDIRKLREELHRESIERGAEKEKARTNILVLQTAMDLEARISADKVAELEKLCEELRNNFKTEREKSEDDVTEYEGGLDEVRIENDKLRAKIERIKRQNELQQNEIIALKKAIEKASESKREKEYEVKNNEEEVARKKHWFEAGSERQCSCNLDINAVGNEVKSFREDKANRFEIARKRKAEVDDLESYLNGRFSFS